MVPTLDRCIVISISAGIRMAYRPVLGMLNELRKPVDLFTTIENF